MTQIEDRGEALARLRQLRESGAITPEDFDRLTRAVNAPPRMTPSAPSAGSRFIQNAGAIGAGVFAGTMTADLLSSAFSEPDSENFEYTSTTETTFTDDGYITTTNETYGPDDGSGQDSASEETAESVYDNLGSTEDVGGFEDMEMLDV